jgi:hypothetical protein
MRGRRGAAVRRADGAAATYGAGLRRGGYGAVRGRPPADLHLGESATVRDGSHAFNRSGDDWVAVRSYG